MEYFDIEVSTTEEVKELLHVIGEIVLSEDSNLTVEDCYLNYFVAINEYLAKVEKSVKKQIPQKPFMFQDNTFGDFTLCCPNCLNSVVRPYGYTKYNPVYCQFCGQKFDWSEEND